MNNESPSFSVANYKPHKPSALLRFSLAILVVVLVIVGLEGFLYFRIRNVEKKPLREEQTSSVKPKSLSKEEEAFLEEKAFEDTEKRRELARKVLGEDYSKYNELSLAGDFGVSKRWENHLVVTGKVSLIEGVSLVVDCGSFSHLAETREDTPVFLIDSKWKCVGRSNTCGKPEKLNISDIRVGDLVALVYERTNSQEPRFLWLIYKYY